MKIQTHRFVVCLQNDEETASLVDIGGKERKSMKKKIKYTNEPLGRLKIVDNFLPPPSELVFKEDTVKVTIGLSKSSIEFFKKEAKNHHTQYQKIIRNLLDRFAALHRDQASSRGK